MPHRPDVDELGAGKPERGGQNTLENRVLGLPAVEGDVQAEAVGEQARLEPGLELLAPLRLQVRITQELWRHSGLAAADGHRLIGPQRGEGLRLLPRLPERRAEAKRRQP